MISYAGQSLSEPGWIRVEGAPDLYWPGGEHVALFNSRLRRPVQRFAPGWPAPQMDGEEMPRVLSDAQLRGSAGDPWWAHLEYGQGFLYGPSSVTVTHGLPENYHKNPPFNVWPSIENWGKVSRMTTSGGSGGLFTYRCPGAVACSVLFHQGEAVTVSSPVGRLAFEMLRGGWLEEDDEWWTSKTWPDLLPYRGYTKNPLATGGPSTLFGAKLPPGVTWSGGTGWMMPDPDHHHGDILSEIALVFHNTAIGSIARIGAGVFAEQVAAANKRENSTGGRGHWHAMRVFAKYCAVERKRGMELLEEELTRIEGRNHYVNGVAIFSHVDRGNSTDAYHMSPTDVAWIAEATGASTKKLAESFTSFMGGIGLLAMDTAFDILGVEVFGGRLWAQFELMLASIHRCQLFALDVRTAQFHAPNILADDCGAPVDKAEFYRIDGEPSDSVRNRFITWGVYRGWLRTKDPRVLQMWQRFNVGVPWKEPLELCSWASEAEQDTA